MKLQWWHWALIVLFVGFVYTQGFRPKSSPATPSTSSSPSIETASPEAPAHPTCLSDDQVQQVASVPLQLMRESYVEEIDVLECSYQSQDSVNNLFPSLQYQVVFKNQDDTWQEKQTELQKKSSYRTFDQKPNYFAHVNEVVDLNQVTVYGKAEKRYVELTYSPVQEDLGSMLNKSSTFLDLLLKD